MIIAPKKFGEQNSAYRHRYEGRSRKRGRPSTLLMLTLRSRSAEKRRQSPSLTALIPVSEKRRIRRPLYAEATPPRESRLSMERESSRLAHSHRVAHALRRLEFNLAGDQDRVTRSPAGFIRRLPLRSRVLVLLVISIGRAQLLPRSRADYLVLAFTGLLMFVSITRSFSGRSCMFRQDLAAVIQASIPIFGMIFAHWMLPDEPLRWQRLAGALGRHVRRRRSSALGCSALTAGWLFSAESGSQLARRARRFPTSC